MRYGWSRAQIPVRALRSRHFPFVPFGISQKNTHARVRFPH